MLKNINNNLNTRFRKHLLNLYLKLSLLDTKKNHVNLIRFKFLREFFQRSLFGLKIRWYILCWLISTGCGCQICTNLYFR